jgi:hypothetical protein
MPWRQGTHQTWNCNNIHKLYVQNTTEIYSIKNCKFQSPISCLLSAISKTEENVVYSSSSSSSSNTKVDQGRGICSLLVLPVIVAVIL